MNISINKDKCKVPMNCRLCLEICPQCVFQIYPTGIKKFEEIPLENWKLRVSYTDLCVGCMECVKICPEKAIKVKLQKSQIEEVVSK